MSELIKNEVAAINKSILFTSKEAAAALHIGNKEITKILFESNEKSYYDTKLGAVHHWSTEQFLKESVVERLSAINKKLNKENIETSLKKILKDKEENKERTRIKLEEAIKIAQENKRIRKEENAKREEEKRIREKREADERHKIHLQYAPLFKETISKTWESNTDTNYILHVGKTNSGKTYNALQRLKEIGSGIYLAPLRLLAWEVYEKLNSEGYRCNLVTGEEQIESPNAKIVSSTIEMANYNKEHEVVIVDEAFMIGDKDRGKSWLNAILNLRAKEIHILLNEESFELVQNILNLTARKCVVNRYEMLNKFSFSDNYFNLSKRMPKRGVFVTFSRINVLLNKIKIENLGYTASVLYGNLPPEIKKQQISDFIEGRTDMLVTTDVIGMGINVPCDYLIFLEIEKYDGETNRNLNPIEIRQIAGRTGRYGLSNENSFVSCVSTGNLNYIRSNYNKDTKVSNAYFGLTYEMFSSFPTDMPIIQRVNYFKNIDFIPKTLKGIIFKEDVEKYLKIESLIESHKFDLKTAWHLLTAPVKYNNENFFRSLIHYYAQNKTLELPHIQNDYNEAKHLEDTISEVELYINLTRHLNHDSIETEKIKKKKEILIDRLTTILMDKKLMNKKKCKLCPTLLDLTYPYPYCEDCYSNKVRSNYRYDFDYDFEDNDDDDDDLDWK